MDRQPLQLAAIPGSALARILHLADCATRASCACTCQYLRSISLLEETIVAGFEEGQQRKVQSLVEWLSKHGGVVTHLAIWAEPQLRMWEPGYEEAQERQRLAVEIPCKQLTQLKSLYLEQFVWHKPSQQDGSVSISSTGSASNGQQTSLQPSNPLLYLRQLTKLSLNFCTTADDDCCIGLSSVAVLTNLRHLDLQSVDSCYLSGHLWYVTQDDRAVYIKSVSQALVQLTQLTHLALGSPSGELVTSVLLNSISSMNQLEQLGIGCGEVMAAGLACIPTSVTRLQLQCSSLIVTAVSTPRLTQLASLRQLHLGVVNAFDTAVLAVHTQLQHLFVNHTCPLERLPFLQGLAQLQQLEHLAIPYTFTDQTALPAPEEAWYVALVASSRLTHLDLQADSPDSFPKEIGQLLFHHPRGLPNLRQLKLGWSSNSDHVPFMFMRPTALPWQLGTAELQLMVECCPALDHLEIVNAVKAGCRSEGHRAYATLQQLTSLTRLSIGGITVDDAVVTNVIAEMQQLKALEILLAPRFGWPGLYELTRLQKLRQVHVQYCSLFPASRSCSDAEREEQWMPDEWDTDLPNWLHDQAGTLEFDSMSSSSGLSGDSFRVTVANGDSFRLAADHSSVECSEDSLSDSDADAAAVDSEVHDRSQLQDSTDDDAADERCWGISSTCRMRAAAELDIFDALEVLITSEVHPSDVASQVAEFCLNNNRYAMFAPESPSWAFPPKTFGRHMHQLLPVEAPGVPPGPMWD